MHHSIPRSPLPQTFHSHHLAIAIAFAKFLAKMFVLFGACTFSPPNSFFVGRFSYFSIVCSSLFVLLVPVILCVCVYVCVCQTYNGSAWRPDASAPFPRPVSIFDLLYCRLKASNFRILLYFVWSLPWVSVSSAFKSSVKCFSMLDFLRPTPMDTDTDADTVQIQIQLQIPISENLCLWLVYFQFASTNRKQLWNAFKWRPKIFSVYLHIVLWLPRQSSIISILLLTRLKISSI